MSLRVLAFTLVTLFCTVKGVTEDSVRLVDGRSSDRGRVEIYHGGRWGIVCDDDWDMRDATVVCRQLAYPAASAATRLSKYGHGDGYYQMDNVHCTGNEASLALCPFNGWGVDNCGDDEAAGVICQSAWSAFSSWSSCTQPCGRGTMSRNRTCYTPTCSGLATETLPCNTHGCPVNGGWSSFSVLQPCAASCGGGTLSRTRTCSNPPPANGGDACVGSPLDVVSCNTNACPVNGGWSAYSDWQTCTSSCGGGIQSRNRTCSDPVPGIGGDDCSGSATAIRPCNTQACPEHQDWWLATIIVPCVAGVLVIAAIVILVVVYRMNKNHHTSLPGRTKNIEREPVVNENIALEPVAYENTNRIACRSSEFEANIYDCIDP